MRASIFSVVLFSALFLNIIPVFAQQEITVIFNEFNSKKETRKAGFKGSYRIVDKDNRSALLVQSKKSRKSWVVLSVPLDRVRGAQLRISTKLKTENVSPPVHSYNGIKIMMPTRTPWDIRYTQAQQIPTGTYDWRDVSFITYVPKEAESCELVLGLEESTGKVWFDNIKVQIVEPQGNAYLANDISQKPYTGHSVSRLRGTMIPTFATPDDLKTLASWGANHVRWQLTWEGFPQSKADTASVESYMKWLNSALDHVYAMLPLCKELGIDVLIDLHTLPGGLSGEGSYLRLFSDKSWQNTFIQAWKQIAMRFHNQPAIWGYELANEPIQGGAFAGVLNWYDLATVTARDIREIDTSHAIILEGPSGADPIGLAMMQPIPVTKVVYSIHVYTPYEFSGQGLGSDTTKYNYPGLINGRYWDKQMLKRSLNMIIDWQHKYDKQIYVGEFSAVRWAPNNSAYNYLKDCIEIFEAQGWDWCYHAFREFDGWSVEHTSDRNNNNPSDVPTERQQLLMHWFEKNERASE